MTDYSTPLRFGRDDSIEAVSYLLLHRRSAQSLPGQQKVAYDEQQEAHGDEAVHGEEGGVQAAQVVVLDQRMLVDQQQATSRTPASAILPKPKASTIQTSSANVMTWNSRASRKALRMPKALGTE